MADSYVKLFASIVTSTVWREPAGTRLVWITMLALKRRDGCVYASVPGLADAAKVSLDECLKALTTLESPDPWSRTREFEGRRIEPMDGGWKILNATKFDRIRSAEDRREYMREYMRERRAKNGQENDDSPAEAVNNHVNSVSRVSPSSSSPRLKERSKESTANAVDVVSGEEEAAGNDPPPCPFEEIVKLYHEVLPELPAVEKLTRLRRGYIRQRWIEDLQTLDAWRNYFADVRKSKFLMGRANGSGDRPPFRATLEWLCRPSNFVKVAEGNYHQ